MARSALVSRATRTGNAIAGASPPGPQPVRLRQPAALDHLLTARWPATMACVDALIGGAMPDWAHQRARRCSRWPPRSAWTLPARELPSRAGTIPCRRRQRPGLRPRQLRLRRSRRRHHAPPARGSTIRPRSIGAPCTYAPAGSGSSALRARAARCLTNRRWRRAAGRRWPASSPAICTPPAVVMAGPTGNGSMAVPVGTLGPWRSCSAQCRPPRRRTRPLRPRDNRRPRSANEVLRMKNRSRRNGLP